MKKTILAALALFPFVASAVEISPGTFQLKGSSTIGFSSDSEKIKYSDGSWQKTETSAVNAELQGLYYLAPGIGVGLVLGYNTSTAKDTSSASSGELKTTLDTFLIGPAVGLDLALAPQFGLFVEGAVGYASGGMKRSGTGVTMTDRVSMSGYGFQLAGGLKFFLERHFSLDAGLAYTYLDVKNTDARFGKPEDTKGTLGVNLGLSVYFGGK